MKPTITSMLILTIFLSTGSPAALGAVETQLSPDIDSIEMDVYFLASDELEGRLAGSPGAEKAAEYIAILFFCMGLIPVDNNYYQGFEITTQVSLGIDNYLSISTPDGTSDLTAGDDFIPLFLSSDSLADGIDGEVVFAGYGITAPEYGWDDYEDIDANGKIVFCLRGEPRQDDPECVFNGNKPSQYSGIRWKAENAMNHGAVALILATGPINLAEGEIDELMSLDEFDSMGESEIPVIQVSQKTAALLLSTMGAPLEMFQGEMDRHMMAFGASPEDIRVSLAVELERERATAWNVGGILPGSDPELSDEYVIISAHYDHIGWGEFGSSYHGSEPQIHNGADDNASGTAGVIELARIFTTNSNQPSRSILFICFSAEEMGCLGSYAYIDDPLIPLDQTHAMINMDMIGRVRPGDDGVPSCTVQGTGSADEWSEIVSRASSESLALIASPNPVGGSDFVPFCLSKIPYLNFFSGVHDDYNRPTDDADRINYIGLATVIEAVYNIAWDVTELPGELIFRESETQAIPARSDVDTGTSFVVYLGTVPDFLRTEGGFWISDVREGSPAAVGGLMAGDQILSLGDFEVIDIYSYTYALGQFKPGDTVEVGIRRDGDDLILTVTFRARDDE